MMQKDAVITTPGTQNKTSIAPKLLTSAKSKADHV
jgi:hypothetical protein